MMGATLGLTLLTILCASIGGATGACRHVKNDDMIEYSCVGGQPADLNDLPETTGKIRITNMPISRITADTFSRFGSELWVLSCSQCDIMDIEPGAFQRLDNLQQLSLDSNYLTTVREPWFRGLNYLTYLDLNYNNIRTIEDGVFENLPSLVDLRLSGNRLECLNLKDMSHLKELRRIFLTENPEFKCPNAVTEFLESRSVSFEKDPEWDKISSDLVTVDVSSDYNTQNRRITFAPTSSMSTFYEKLHSSYMTTPPSEDPRLQYVPSRVYSTKETILYPPEASSTDWRTSESVPPTPSYYERYPIPSTTSRSTYEDTRTSYTPPRVIQPLDTTTYAPYVTTARPLDLTTMKSWPSVSESGTAVGSESALYPPHENENKHYEQPAYPSEVTRSPSLAPSPIDDQETPVFVEPNVDRTVDPYKTYWIPDHNEAFSGMRYPAENEPTDYSPPSAETSEKNRIHVIRPLPPSGPELIQPASPGDFFQAPYNEPTVTIRPPPPINYQQQEQTTLSVLSIETTTDKPLPECPNRSSSSSTLYSVWMITVSVLLVVMKNVLVEGF